MKKIKFNWEVDWKSKLIDLLIVIIGISIAFKLNTWNETIKTDKEARIYIESFYEETSNNVENLNQALSFTLDNKNNIDTLKRLLISKRYDDPRIKELVATMMGLANFAPTISTMENIIASGEFELIRDIELRKSIINTYKTYEASTKFENLLKDYIDKYATTYFIKNIRFVDFSSLKNDFLKDAEFENIVFGYDVLLNQEISGYKKCLQSAEELENKLSKHMHIR